jgi:hypothetical protein
VHALLETHGRPWPTTADRSSPAGRVQIVSCATSSTPLGPASLNEVSWARSSSDAYNFPPTDCAPKQQQGEERGRVTSDVPFVNGYRWIELGIDGEAITLALAPPPPGGAVGKRETGNNLRPTTSTPTAPNSGKPASTSTTLRSDDFAHAVAGCTPECWG